MYPYFHVLWSRRLIVAELSKSFPLFFLINFEYSFPSSQETDILPCHDLQVEIQRTRWCAYSLGFNAEFEKHELLICAVDCIK
jgi:hypothetical protein